MTLMENKLSGAQGQYLFWNPAKKNIPETGLSCQACIPPRMSHKINHLRPRPNNFDPACGTESPPRYASPQYPAPHPNPQSSAQPSESGHAPLHLTPVVASPVPANAPHPTTIRSKPESAAYSSESSQRSAAKLPWPTPSSVPPPCRTAHAAVLAPPAPWPESHPPLRRRSAPQLLILHRRNLDMNIDPVQQRS